MTTKSPVALIEHKRDGGEHSAAELHGLLRAFLDGSLADYQMSAWLMAVYLRGLSDAEMVALTEAMLHSGKTLSWPEVPGLKIDKHSTGGVGDKLSLPLGPLVACCGLFVPMVAGRGLGHTGGTLDKLEAIPGYRTDLSIRSFQKVVRLVGASIIGQTAELAPADKRIYALRDVTGTVACRPLIVASILSKKLAAGLDGLVLDVKVGGGAFMKDKKSALALARSLTQVSAALGTPARAVLTRMDEPLGRTIGNALEVHESLQILRGEGPADTTELTLLLGEEMLLLGGVAPTRAQARRALQQALSSGAALERFGRLVAAHGGDARVVERPQLLPRTKQRWAVPAARGGWVREIDSLGLAQVALDAGAGRKRASDAIDPAVGIELCKQRGDSVEAGEPLAWLHLRKAAPELIERTLAAFTLGARAPTAQDSVLARVRG